MKNLLKIPKKHMHFYLLSVVMILFIVFPVEVPSELGGLLDSMLGKIVIVVLVLNLFMAHPVVGAIGAVTAYELIRRTSGMANVGSTMMKQYVPSEKKRTMGWSLFRPTGLTHKDSRTSGGYTLVTPIGGDMTCLIDEDGQIAHRWLMKGFQPGYGHLLPGGNLLVTGFHCFDSQFGIKDMFIHRWRVQVNAETINGT